jgi:hypothetical protein
MKHAGWIARLMLVIALLPWGAFHGTGHGAGRGLALIETALHSLPGQSLHAGGQPGKAAALAPQPRRCKTGVLTGAGCAPDALLASRPSLARPSRQGASLSLQAIGLAATLPEPPPRRPPRSA